MTGGPWTRSMKVVHGPGPKWGSMDPWSMFCPYPEFKAQLEGFNMSDTEDTNTSEEEKRLAKDIDKEIIKLKYFLEETD